MTENYSYYYEQLFAGKVIILDFPNKKAIESFRNQLAKVKIRREKHYLELGFLQREEIKKLSFQTESIENLDNEWLPATTYRTTIKLAERGPNIKFTVISIE